MTSNISQASRRGALVIFAVFAALLMAMRPLMPIDETRYLTVAWEMWQGGSKLVPHLNGDLYTHKPPLLFWLIDLAWAVTGQSEWAARLVAPAFGLLSVGLTGMLARRLWPEAPERAGFAALILATSGVFLLFGSTTMFDTILTAATLIGMMALWALRDGLRPGAVIWLGVALGLGVYAKGPVILVHLMPVALLMPIWAGPEARARAKGWYGRIGVAFLIGLALVALWLGPALVLGGPEYREQVLWKQSAGRVVDSFAHGRPVWYFLALLPLYLWPWGWSRSGLAALSPRKLWADPAARMVTLWALSGLILFSLISGKQAHYLLPEMPALALMLSGALPLPRRYRWPRLVWLLPGLLAVIATLAMLLGKVKDMPPQAGSWLFWGAGVLVLVALGAVLMRLRDGWRAEIWVAPVVLVALHLMLWPQLWRIYDARPLGVLLAAHADHGIATTDSGYAGQFSYVGRLPKPVDVLPGPEALPHWISTHPGGVVLAPSKLENVDGLSLIAERHFRQRDWRIYQATQATAPAAAPSGSAAPSGN